MHSQNPVVKLETQMIRGEYQYMVWDVYDCLIIATRSYKLAQRYFELAQQWQTVSRIAHRDRYIDLIRQRREGGPAARRRI